MLLGAAFALGGGAGLCLAARQRLREHSAAEVTRRRARREKGRLGRRGADSFRFRGARGCWWPVFDRERA